MSWFTRSSRFPCTRQLGGGRRPPSEPPPESGGAGQARARNGPSSRSWSTCASCVLARADPLEDLHLDIGDVPVHVVLDVIHRLGDDLVGVARIAGDAGDGERGTLPGVVVVHFGDGDLEALTELVLETLQDVVLSPRRVSPRLMRTRAVRMILPSMTEQPKIVPTLEMGKSCLICARPWTVSRISGASMPLSAALTSLMTS